MINAADTLRLEGSVVGSNPTAFDYMWSELGGSGLLSDNSGVIAPQLTLGVSQRNLVIVPGLLEVGEIYVRWSVLMLICYASQDIYPIV